MVDQSCLYECRVMHERYIPKHHRFEYGLFMAYLDLDELPQLASKMKFFRFNQSGFFSFQELDHWPNRPGTLKERIQDFLTENDVNEQFSKVCVLTNLRHAGYVFNPATFYFCYKEQATQPFAVILEVQNTFNEVKPFLIQTHDTLRNVFLATVPKYFYVSPYSALDVRFNAQIEVPSEKLSISIESLTELQDEKKILLATLTGQQRPLTDLTLLRCAWKYPLMSWRVSLYIHWQALLLLFKGLKPQAKNLELTRQQGILNPISMEAS